MDDRERKAIENGLMFAVIWAEHWRSSDAYGAGRPNWHPNHQKIIDDMCEILGKPKMTAQGPSYKDTPHA